MPVCPKCGVSLAENAQFCPRDGTTIAAVAQGIAPVAKAAAAAAVPAPAVPAQTIPGLPSRTSRQRVAVDPADLLIGRVLDGRYRIRARLGQGGVGAVYEGEHTEMKRPVAIKVLHSMFGGSDEFRKRFEREAQAASRLAHAGCVAVLDFGRVERVEPPEPKLLGTLYLVMEFVRGQALVDRLEAGPALAPREAVAIARSVLAALEHAHSLGLVHRDVKPANIMILPGGGTKLLDFGLAKELDPADGGEALTQAGMVFGTPGYLSPEQAAGRPADTRADLYALGVVLFEMACNRRLFPRADPLDVVRAHLNEAPDKPRSVNPSLSLALEAAILRALAKDPAARFSSAKDLDAALAETPEASAAPAPSGAPSGSPSASSARRPKPIVLGGIAGGVVLLATLLVIFSRGGKAPAAVPPPPAPVLAPVAPPSESARRHLGLAVAHQRKLWCSDALEELDRAMRDDPRVAGDPEVARLAIACLTPKTQPKAIRFLVEKVGEPARPALTAAAAADPNLDVRKGAERALDRLAKGF